MNIKKFAALAAVMVMTIASVLPATAMALTPFVKAMPNYPLGNVEVIDNTKVQGWVYYKDAPVSITLTFVNNVNNPTDVRNYVISNTQNSNKISYFVDRPDVDNYLGYTYGNATITRPTGFMLTNMYLPQGQWTFVQAIAHSGSTSSTLPIIPTNRTMNVTYSEPYIEGYIDSTNDMIKGWAYSSDIPENEYAPDINITVSKGADKLSFAIDRHSIITSVGGNGPIIYIRDPRQDVVDFLYSKRGQKESYFSTSSHNQMGFAFHYKNVLSSGTWTIESVYANNTLIPYGNNSLTNKIVVP
jgi:hypothetical protein